MKLTTDRFWPSLVVNMQSPHLSRRRFLKGNAILGSGLLAASAFAPTVQVLGANDRLRLGVMGTNGRGSSLARSFSSMADVEVSHVCDVDRRAIDKGLSSVADSQSRRPRGVRDFRRILDDPTVDALVIAAPDHWHGPATILACAAGKHVYVEKPASHNPREGELMIAAARKHDRVVQIGTQRRSMPWIMEAIQKVRDGSIGRVRFSRGWYSSARGSIGRGRPVPAPEWLDWRLWQGPAPERPFRDNLVHYNWHWFWDWGTGELGNNGIHALDLCRWGLGVDFPRRVSAGGGRYHYDDDQETPDTMVLSFDFGDRAISWEGRSCQRHGIEGSMFGAAFMGDQGTLVIDGNRYKVFDKDDKEIQTVSGSGSDRPHLLNFLQAIRGHKRPHADVGEGHKSTLLCHLGNIAYRTGSALYCDPRNGRILNNGEASKLWSREYRDGWTPRV